MAAEMDHMNVVQYLVEKDAGVINSKDEDMVRI